MWTRSQVRIVAAAVAGMMAPAVLMVRRGTAIQNACRNRLLTALMLPGRQADGQNQ